MPVALIVEDHEDQALVFERAANLAGFTVTSIDNGRLASEYLKDNVPDLIVLEPDLSDSCGTQILTQIASDPRLDNIRVILATADAIIAESTAEMADVVLLKPVSFHQMTCMCMKVRHIDKRRI
jgi:CheY-like chemotaxis protein